MHRTAFGSFVVALLLALFLAWGSHSSVSADPPTPIPPGFLPFLGGGEGDPDALAPAAAAATPCVRAIPPGYLSFFGGGAGDPYGASTPAKVPCG